MKPFEQLNVLINKLDEANGRLIIAAASDTNVRTVMESIAEVSIKLAELAENMELRE